jgi:hypothetical protein
MQKKPTKKLTVLSAFLWGEKKPRNHAFFSSKTLKPCGNGLALDDGCNSHRDLLWIDIKCSPTKKRSRLHGNGRFF